MRGFVNPASYKMSKANAATYVNGGALLLGSSHQVTILLDVVPQVRRLYGVAVESLLSLVTREEVKGLKSGSSAFYQVLLALDIMGPGEGPAFLLF